MFIRAHQTPRVRLPNGFTPRAHQVPFMRYFDDGGKRAVWVVCRRGGKDLTSLHQTCKAAHERRAVYWHVYPVAEQARKAIWEGFTRDGQRIMEQVFPKAIRKRPKDWAPGGDMVVELKCGSIWRLLGSDRIEVVGAGPAGVVFTEFALAKRRAWDLIAPMLDENGGWAAFPSTPRGNNHLKQLYDAAGKLPGWWRALRTIHDIGGYDTLTAEQVLANARARGMPEPLIRQEYLCDFTAALVGSIWGDLIEVAEKEGRLEAFEHERDGIHVHFDLGISDSTAMWWWRLGDKGADFLDYYEAHGKPMSHYYNVLDERAAKDGWKYTALWLPHDARQRTLQTGESICEQVDAECRSGRWGAARMVMTPGLSKMDGIQAGRWLLQQHTRFHPRAAEGVEALKQYHYAYDEDQDRFSREPEHDWSSHGADAWRYAAVAYKMVLARKPESAKPTPPPLSTPTLSTLTLDQLLAPTPGHRRERIG